MTELQWIDLGRKMSELRNTKGKLIGLLVLFNEDYDIWFLRYKRNTTNIVAKNIDEAKNKATEIIERR